MTPLWVLLGSDVWAQPCSFFWDVVCAEVMFSLGLVYVGACDSGSVSETGLLFEKINYFHSAQGALASPTCPFEALHLNSFISICVISDFYILLSIFLFFINDEVYLKRFNGSKVYVKK